MTSATPNEHFNRIDEMLERLTQRQLESQEQINALAAQVNALSALMTANIAQSNAFLATEQRERSEFRQQMLGLQSETRNILMELADLRRQQRGNGSGQQ